ncbi:Uncharacterized protein FKW44_000269 [Caligus rogercresseyi]|uniref:Uncharacterized protein n=1 Tax=Caligus rogercresseyi TaxID=217165 RepID=A0A7T8KH63_CALRO|nr:Uncharacterized protein FKW44_000269 [Caligus rogercresseyi]
MERTRRDTAIELLCAGHRLTAIIKLLKYPRRTVYDITKNNVASLKAEMNKLDPAEVSTACGRFRRRLKGILEAEGGHIE